MKVSVIGMGAVGTELVGCLLHMSEATEIVAVDKSREKSEAEMWDFAHTTAFTYAKNPDLVVGDYADTAGSDVVVITAGAQIQKGQSRDAIVRENAVLIQPVIAAVERYSPEAVVIIVTNPVDVITQVALHHSGYPRTRLISAGTLVDSARFMRILSDHVKIDPKNIFGYVLGDHGASCFIPWSICNVCGLDVDSYCELNGLPPIDKTAIRQRVIDAGFEIFNRKGNTNHGIAAGVFRIIRAIEANERSVLPVGVMLQGEYGFDDVVVSVPCVIGRHGVDRILSYRFTEDETRAFERSEAHLRSMIAVAHDL
ncbi:lactate/malate family dehydrogenase [Paludibacterium yongneupense]|uniref:lactate/malate family dehydrogenase n=1 Tax=Paludibacterium yongneupense TaxID=400061 RepID=UPI00048D2771|nr:malate dehydrogenase [Paludibacterium yongneupense]